MSKNGGHLTVQYNLRWSEELRDKIADEAKKNTRSMNQEIIARLEHSFRSESASKPLLSFDKDTSHLVIGDAEERKRLAQIAAKAVFDALGQSLDQDDDEKKAP
ncbi:Arc family DNA-binding protein [Acinetobacter baumannii]|uniref:Arc family DNA-binding protein n=1 Tax=Acinetobacter baumannii TaxID=470 RepID=UPI000DD026CC|nr:Arc family DNA-binding protein [Acinetobacter baumannii]